MKWHGSISVLVRHPVTTSPAAGLALNDIGKRGKVGCYCSQLQGVHIWIERGCSRVLAAWAMG